MLTGLIYVAAGLLLGFLFPRPWVFVAALAVPLYFLGLKESWWGNGVGDQWQWAMLFLILLGVMALAAGAALSAVLKKPTP